MKRGLAYLLAAVLLFQLTACGGETPATSAPSREPASATSAASEALPSAADTTAVPEPPTEPPHLPPRTAYEPGALTLQTLSHASGVTENYTDPETGREYVVWEDLGEDGHTRTMNCFDEEGKLVWWEAFEYDENEAIIRINRWSESGALISQELLTYENGVLASMEHDIAFYEEGKNVQLYKTFEESYYPDGKLLVRATFYPFWIMGFYALEHIYQYAEDGTELHHICYDPYGAILEESYNGEKVILVPDSVGDMFEMLNKTSAEEFDAVWEACLKKIGQTNQTEKWDALCETFSGLIDEFSGTPLYRLREEYHLSLFASGRAGSLYRNHTVALGSILPSVKNDTVNPLLRERLYRPGSHLDFGGTLWLPEEFSPAISAVTEAPPRKEGDPIRILVLDSSETIRSEAISSEMLLSEDSMADDIVERAETILKGLFGSREDLVILTSYPDQADVILELKTEYPFAGQYAYTSGTIANVWNTVVNVRAYNRQGSGEADAVFRHLAGQTVTVSGGTIIYMRVPDPADEEYREAAQSFVSTVFSWFPDLPQE